MHVIVHAHYNNNIIYIGAWYDYSYRMQMQEYNNNIVIIIILLKYI